MQYELNWIGKSYAKTLVSNQTDKVLVPDDKHNSEAINSHSDNIFIEGDNLDALKILQSSYTGKVKMIYIDPPYNTGRKFIYSDKFTWTSDELSKALGVTHTEAKQIIKNTSRSHLSHSAWLTFMYPRLCLARDLLTDDGVIFISIDDNEQAQLKLLCDEVFGEENFVADFIWDKKNSAKGVPPKNMVVNIHEYIVCYSKNTTKLLGELRTKEGFHNPDNDIRGEWRLSNIKSTLEKPQDKFIIKDPKTGWCFENYWAFSQNSLEKMIKEERIIFPKNPDGLPKQKEFFSEFVNPYMPIKSHLGWFDPQSTMEKKVESLMGSKIFLYRKPVELIKKIISQSDSSNEIFMDFFSGSGTTAHAVMQLNAEDNGNRHFICVQLPEVTDEKSEAFKAGFKNIAEISKERIRRAGKQIAENHPDKQLDIGFKVFKIKQKTTN